MLASLAGGSKHGYAITRDVEQMAGVRLGPGTLYGALSHLEAKGLSRSRIGFALQAAISTRSPIARSNFLV